MGPNRIPRRDWLLGTSASLLALGASSPAAAALGQPRTPSPQPQTASEAEDADRPGPWNVNNPRGALRDIASVKREKSNRFGETERCHCKIDAFQAEHRPSNESTESRGD